MTEAGAAQTGGRGQVRGTKRLVMAPVRRAAVGEYARDVPPPAPGVTLLTGVAGSGKSSRLRATALRHLREEGTPVLMISSSRAAASRFAADLAAESEEGLGASRSMTWPAFAFEIISRAEAQGLIPWMRGAPRLRTGAEQDHRYHALLSRVPEASLPPTMALAAGTLGLRQQLRDFADQAIQVEADPEADVTALAARHNRPEWALAGRLMAEYRFQSALGDSEALDALELSLVARGILRENPEFGRAEAARQGLLVVDDAHNVTMPELALLEALVGALRPTGAPAIVAFDEASAVQVFRGADPARTGRRLAALADRQEDAGPNRRSSGTLAAVAESLRARLGVQPLGPGAAAPAADARGEAAGGEVECLVVSHPFHEHRLIGTRILDLVVSEGANVGFADIAVVVRSGSEARSVERQLTSLGIPVEVPPAVLTLKETPAVRPLVALMEVVVSAEEPEVAVLTEVLTSPLIGMSSVDLRRARQELRRRARLALVRSWSGEPADQASPNPASGDPMAAGGGGAPLEGAPPLTEARIPLSDQLLIEAASDPASETGIEGIDRLSRMIAAGRREYETKNKDPQHVLWGLWEESGRAPVWRSAAAGTGAAADRANRDLDAVMSLFYAAERFMDQRPGAAADEFLAELIEQAVPVDTVAKRAAGGSAVSVLTPVTAAGREFAVVFVAGVQEGRWPNPRVRGELFGTSDFLEALAAEREGRPVVYSGHAERVSAVRRDELRLFLAAITRATSRLVITAVNGDGESPSLFFDLVALAAGLSPHAIRPVHPPRPQTIRALIGELRRAAESAPAPEAADAASVLALLATSGVRDASLTRPETWWGSRALSTTAPVVGPEAVIVVSPSKIQQAIEDPLGWFVQYVGGEPAREFSRSLGTLVHALAERYPSGEREELTEALERAWADLNFDDSLSSRAERAHAEHLVSSFAQYAIQARSEGRDVTAGDVEKSFLAQVELPVRGVPRTVVLKGTIDRLERRTDGGWTVVDLKTSKTSVTAAEGAVHPQMAVYQYAAELGGLEGVERTEEALLVYLGKPNAKKVATVRQQGAGISSLAEVLVAEAARTMTGASFAAYRAGERDRSQLPEIDPLLPQGRPVTRLDLPENSPEEGNQA
ncbi:ATP-dependent DNA helicase [Falsarthrobacter nasiphocae]|uniref:DNA 3'-5' helicase n=1 Tax=Falsarthrobacter nasiphocae TaxID=189863 RepID=A0AAE3YGN0_9MICC|nr:superfamily I DNA/RNA helicase/RecB family exonuclease [Falsarthrobacter nasiphocae]